MNKKHINVVLILVLVVLCISTVLIKTKEYKDSKIININIASTLSNVQNQKLEEKLNEVFNNYRVNIYSYSDTALYEANKGAGDIIVGLDEMYMKKLDINYTKINKLIPVIVKNKELEELNSYRQLGEEKYKNLIAITPVETSNQSYSLIERAYSDLDEKEAQEYMKKLKSNIDEKASNDYGVMNLLEKDIKKVGVLPLEIANEFVKENQQFEILKEESYIYYNRTLAYIPVEDLDEISDEEKQRKEFAKEVYEYIVNNVKFENEDEELNLVYPDSHIFSKVSERIKIYSDL